MLIGELSRRTGVRPHQLRYYESQGLLAPDRSPGGYRDYPEGAVLTVRQIRKLLDAGLNTDDIAYLLPCVKGDDPELPSCPEAVDLLQDRLRVLDERAATLARSRAALRDYVDVTTARRR
ncbi:MerR family transcriptional regulator [Streptomyces sp. NPDC012637]|uniref:MerR family transcriptional regulator n=1 Tax=Streptomyces sp. NPDC012637 TaxID=3364842 RepID=UPI0036E8D5FE